MQDTIVTNNQLEMKENSARDTNVTINYKSKKTVRETLTQQTFNLN